MLFDLVNLGPLNGGVLLALLLLGGGAIVYALRRVHRGERVPLVPVAIAMLLPLLFATWAATFQHHRSMEWAQTHPSVHMRQTYMAGVLMRTVLTQVASGAMVAAFGVSLMLGSVLLTVRGERPRWLAGALACLIGLALVVVASFSLAGSADLAVLTGVRVAIYAVAVALTIAALVSAHRRGPGMQLAAIASVSVPLVVVGTDLLTLGAITYQGVIEIARAAVDDRQALLVAALQVLDALQTTGWLTLSLAVALAMIGPGLVWRRERPMVGVTMFALAVVVLVAGVGLTYSTAWTASFR